MRNSEVLPEPFGAFEGEHFALRDREAEIVEHAPFAADAGKIVGFEEEIPFVMAALVAATHQRRRASRSWVAGTARFTRCPAMTNVWVGVNTYADRR